MPNLRILVLSGNKICRFEGTVLVKYCPRLEWIDFSNNQIDVLDDLIMLGSLENCQALDISGNPVLGYLKWINVLE
jgi:Leucine-rich repeat (LRR) protein